MQVAIALFPRNTALDATELAPLGGTLVCPRVVGACGYGCCYGLERRRWQGAVYLPVAGLGCSADVVAC
jgi:hypothetical protein